MYICILDSKGDVLVHRNIDTNLEQFLHTITPYREDIAVLMVLMFSQFMHSEGQVVGQVLFLTFALALVNIPNHFIWGYAGELISNRLNSKSNYKTSNRIFSAMLFFVAIYILIS
jgi:threonine/homoserine/homoserine lactone efflux protein